MNASMDRRGIGMALLFALPLTAAGANAAPPPRIDACALLDRVQIERAIGRGVDAGVNHDAGVESNGAWSSSCVWTFVADVSMPADRAASPFARGFVMLNAMRWPRGRAHEFLDSFRDAAAQGVLSRTPTPRRLGDEALWWGDGLAVRKGDVSFGLSVHAPGAPAKTPGAAEARLAPLVLKKLDGVPSRPPNSARS
ncbi:MAG: hypothetical protein QM661_04715 [Solimonas sp.]